MKAFLDLFQDVWSDCKKKGLKSNTMNIAILENSFTLLEKSQVFQNPDRNLIILLRNVIEFPQTSRKMTFPLF